MNSKSYLPEILSFTLSLMLSLTGLWLITLMLESGINQNPAKLSSPLKAQLRPLKTVGIKDSNNKDFNSTIGQRSKEVQKIQKSPLTPKLGNSPVSIKPSASKTDIKDLQIPKVQFNQNINAKDLKSIPQSTIRDPKLKQKTIGELQPLGLIDDVILNSEMALRPELPEGVNEDELNSIEKRYYGFQRRLFSQYINTFITTYNEIKKENPLIKKLLQEQSFLMTARVTYDVDGNIMKLEILKSSEYDDVHDLYETALRKMQKVPNPPDDFLNSKDEFIIYYVLKIN